MELLLVCTLCVVFGWFAREVYAVHQSKKFFRYMQEQNESEEEFEQIVIDKHNDIFFVYSRVDNTFMAQGKSIKELENNLASRYPGKRFGATNDNLKEVGFLK
jgi:hypothetical protein